jgi:Outer membrane protein beta-barrel domain
MKSFILSAAIILLGYTAANAQWFAAGLKLGTNVNKIQGVSFEDKFTYGYSAGVFTEIKLNKKFSLQPEVVFNQVNTDTSDKFSQLYKINASKISSIKLNYLSIPVLLNYHLSKGIMLQAGPQFGVLVNQSKNLLENGKDAFKGNDFAMVGGLQLKISSIRVYGRYAVGLNNLNDIDNKDKWKNQSIQLGVGITLF